MGSDIRPGVYVRVARGMYAGTAGHVASVFATESTYPWASVDVGDALVGVSLSALEIVDAPITAEQERDAAIAERDRLRAQLHGNTLLKETLRDRDTLRAERDRLRRELEALRDEMREWCHGLDAAACHRAVLYGPTIDRIDAILAGPKKESTDAA